VTRTKEGTVSVILSCPKYKKETEGGRTFTVRSIKEWNTLPIDIKQSETTKTFKKKLFSEVFKKQKEYNIFAQI